MDVHPPKNGIFIGIDPYPFLVQLHHTSSCNFVIAADPWPAGLWQVIEATTIEPFKNHGKHLSISPKIRKSFKFIIYHIILYYILYCISYQHQDVMEKIMEHLTLGLAQILGCLHCFGVSSGLAKIRHRNLCHRSGGPWDQPPGNMIPGHWWWNSRSSHCHYWLPERVIKWFTYEEVKGLHKQNLLRHLHWVISSKFR